MTIATSAMHGASLRPLDMPKIPFVSDCLRLDVVFSTPSLQGAD
jgi:hypothetical protein